MPDAIPVMPDHDILITLVETVKNNQTTVLDKIDDVKSKVQEVNDGISSQVKDHELRIKAIEQLHDEINPKVTAKTVQELSIWKTQLDFKLKFLIIAAFAIGGFIQWLVSQGIVLLTHLLAHH